MLTQLICRTFRNLGETQWEPGGGCHLILGGNGAGKTSLLEAVYVVATTRSFRTAQLLDCRRHGTNEFFLEAEVESDQRSRLEVGLAASGKTRSVNGTGASLAEHLRVLPVVSWTAAEGALLNGPPEGRRRFIDQGIVSARPASLEVLARYRRALAQKRQLLVRGESGLDPWNQILAQEASALMVLRRDYLVRLAEALDRVVSEVDLDLPSIDLSYRPSIECDYDDSDRVWQELDAVRSQEQIESRPLLGPHRDEVEIRWGGHLIKRVGSAGERKILGLLISVARGRVLSTVGRSPLYLLDDADSELDKRRLEAIWALFRRSDQVFVSSNRSAVWEMDMEAKRWHLKAGFLKPG